MTTTETLKQDICIMQDLVPVSKWQEKFNYPTKASLRKLIFNSETNNFKKVIKRIGNRIYISISAFNKWVEEQNQIA